MSIDLGALPPEVTSALMYSGPGSSSLVAAASAWNALAAELTSTAQGYDTVVTQLAGEEWLGPASAAMAAAVQPYVGWMTTTAGQAEHAAAQAQSAAAAFETAFASVVPPPLIAANRTALTQALQTNLFGLNNGVIAQLESQYAAMWAQNASTMYGYAGSSATASQVTPFTAAPAIANPTAAATQAASTPAASIQSTLQNFFNQISTNLQTLASPTGVQKLLGQFGTNNPWLTEVWFLLTGQTVLPTNLGTMVNGYAPYAGLFYNTEGLPYFSTGMSNTFTQIAKSTGLLNAPAAAAAAIPKPPTIPGLGAGGQVAAGLGNGAHVGHLAVPASFPGASTAPPAVRPAVQMISEPITSGAGNAGGSSGNVLGGMPVGAGTGARGTGVGPRYGFKPTIMGRPLPAG